MRAKILILFIGFSFTVYSQIEDKVERTFILHFIQEDILMIKNVHLNKREYNPDLINVEYDMIGEYYSEIIFYRFKLGNNKVDTIDESFEIKFNSSSCKEYILGFNVITQESFRLKGFGGNDLYFFLKDINHFFYNQKTIKNILLELNKLNIGINFKELYNDLKKFNFDSSNLKACSEPKEAHGKR